MEPSTIWMLIQNWVVYLATKIDRRIWPIYKLENPYTLINGIPKLPDNIFNMARNPEPQAPTVSKPIEYYDNNMVRQ